ncbi:MAG: ribonuclease HII [Dehalococcoidia bacterium]|nr:ribonuclease HII [Dehalococcoidia bacterium]
MVVTPNLKEEEALWARGYRHVAGVDEVGRGPLAGPVVAAAVVLPQAAGSFYHLVRDSKTLSAAQRDRLYEEIAGHALAWATAAVPPEEIDRAGIGPATKKAMAEAIGTLCLKPDYVLVDAVKLPTIGLPQKSIIKGDATCLSIAAASILAKVCRDRLMEVADREHPGYGFARHKGYGTAEHLAQLHKLGLSPLHRKSFAPVTMVEGGAKAEQRRQILGRLGERIALRHLKGLGYIIRETNYRSLWGEIDIVAQQGDTLVFVEVRCRTCLNGGRRESPFGTPEESLTPAKGARLVETAQTYIQTHADLPDHWRIDLVAVELTPAGRIRRVEVLENAVWDT